MRPKMAGTESGGVDSIGDIVLIGPIAVGKTTVGALLADRLRVPLVSMDDHRFGYYLELGYDEVQAHEILATNGPQRLIRYWQQFDAYAVERLLADFRDCVIDMGAGSTVNESEEDLDRITAALAPYPNVVLLLPFEDEERSRRFLDGRTGRPGGNTYFVGHPSYRRLAKKVVLLGERSAEEVAEAILEACDLSQPD